MQIDGIKKRHEIQPKKILLHRQIGMVRVSSVIKTSSRHKVKIEPTFFRPGSLMKLGLKKQVSLLVSVAGLLLAFSGGIWFTLSTSPSAAENEPQVLGEQTSAPSTQSSIIPLGTGGSLGPVSLVPNDVLFNMTISQLENYLAESNKPSEDQGIKILAARKDNLKNYLDSKNSPLSAIVDTLAELKHWKLVLAISNSESSLGKRCYNNNCSGIGVEPGHPLWRNYNSKADWAKDLDRLLEKRYNNWTLEKMNGVYNYPGSKNWLMASKQILEDLQEQGIE